MTATHPHPLDQPSIDGVWTEAAARLGFRVERTTEAYASSDGRGTIALGAPETLDADDSLAQLVLHELCHALVQGEASLRRPDWGLDNTSDRDLGREHACLRLQAHLADGQGLRGLYQPTTISREYYNVIPPYALEPPGEAPVLESARAAERRARAWRWLPALVEALDATAALVRTAGRFAYEGHPLGLPAGPAGARCADCAWCYEGGEGPRCRQSAGGQGTGHRIDRAFPACARWEPALDCRACAACCREGFDRVTVGVREEVVWRHPALVVRGGPRFALARAGGRCAALVEDGAFACAIYPDRPSACRELRAGDSRCLSARRRVGLSAGGG